MVHQRRGAFNVESECGAQVFDEGICRESSRARSLLSETLINFAYPSLGCPLLPLSLLFLLVSLRVALSSRRSSAAVPRLLLRPNPGCLPRPIILAPRDFPIFSVILTRREPIEAASRRIVYGKHSERTVAKACRRKSRRGGRSTANHATTDCASSCKPTGRMQRARCCVYASPEEATSTLPRWGNCR